MNQPSTLLENHAPTPEGENQPASPVNRDPIKPATRAKKLGEQQPAQSRGMILLGVLLVIALLLFVFRAPHPAKRPTSAQPISESASKEQEKPSPAADPNIVPLTEAVNPPNPSQGQALAETDIERTATQQPSADPSQTPYPGSLGAIPAFSDSANPSKNLDFDPEKLDRTATNSAPSLVFTRRTIPNSSAPDPGVNTDYSVGLPPGFRLRARLETSATTAVRMPVVAVIEYNYEQDGTILIPAGTKAIGRIDQADASGYVSIHFESLQLPSGAPISIDCVATDTHLQPLRGKVQGRNTGKQILVKSLSGLGEVASLVVGRGSLNQPLSESDLLRERIGDNIGQASDQQLNSLSLTQHIVVTLPANTPIYLVFQKSAKTLSGAERSNTDHGTQQMSIEQLRQLLQLQRELAEQH